MTVAFFDVGSVFDLSADGWKHFPLREIPREARKAIVEWFRQNKLLEDVKPYRHTVGHSYRSHAERVAARQLGRIL